MLLILLLSTSLNLLVTMGDPGLIALGDSFRLRGYTSFVPFSVSLGLESTSLLYLALLVCLALPLALDFLFLPLDMVLVKSVEASERLQGCMIDWITITICVKLAALRDGSTHLSQLIPTFLSLFERRVRDVRMEGELAIGVFASKPWPMSFSHSLGSQLRCCRVVWLLIYIYFLVWTSTRKLTTPFINIGCVLIFSFFFFMLSALSVLLSC